VDSRHQVNTAARDPRIDATASMPRAIMPADGSIAESEGHVAVFCAHCARWVDCHADIDPTTALQRHSDLIH
jgi:hypothetical protein